MREFKLGVAIALAVAIGACRDNATTINQVSSTDVTGTWSYTVTNLTGAVNFSCSITGATLSLVQTGDTLTGSVSGGVVSCLTPNGVANVPLSGGAITNSGINGNTLQINFGNPNIKSVGSVSGNSIFGQVAVRGILGNMAQLTGNFSAARQ